MAGLCLVVALLATCGFVAGLRPSREHVRLDSFASSAYSRCPGFLPFDAAERRLDDQPPTTF